jgi:hypothetical protein
MSNDPKYSGVRLSGFAAASLWHRRMIRTAALNYAKVSPRLSPELTLRPVHEAVSQRGFPIEPPRDGSRCHAA